MVKHTQGPWILNTTKVSGEIVRWHVAGPVHGSAFPICEHIIEEEPSGTEQLYNARLIAAAPELLEALEFTLNAVCLAGWEDDFSAEKARAAIAKATGASHE